MAAACLLLVSRCRGLWGGLSQTVDSGAQPVATTHVCLFPCGAVVTERAMDVVKGFVRLTQGLCSFHRCCLPGALKGWASSQHQKGMHVHMHVSNACMYTCMCHDLPERHLRMMSKHCMQYAWFVRLWRVWLACVRACVHVCVCACVHAFALGVRGWRAWLACVRACMSVFPFDCRLLGCTDWLCFFFRATLSPSVSLTHPCPQAKVSVGGCGLWGVEEEEEEEGGRRGGGGGGLSHSVGSLSWHDCCE